MARPLRIQFPGARYHIIDRGNYRHAVFASAGAAHAFTRVLDEAATRYAWRIHAHALIPNHFHLALETPEPNLVEGMHWLLGTFASRFNRFRDERGHLFQGRYQAPLVEDDAHFVRLINYVHLNPVRAGLVSLEQLPAFRWSSMHALIRGPRASWLTAAILLGHLGLADTPAGWRRYLGLLGELAGDPLLLDAEDVAFTRGWAIGSPTWKSEVIARYPRVADDPGISAAERRAANETRWQRELDLALSAAGKSVADVTAEPKSVPWKIVAAVQLRVRASAPHRWIAQMLNMGAPASVRVYVSRQINL
jgi:putative transposase